MLESWRQDARYALRGLGRSPLFTLIAVLSLAVGIGATTSIFSLVNAFLLKPAPGVAEPERLVDVGRTQDGQGFDTFSYPNYLDLRARARTLDGFAVMRVEPQAMAFGTEAGAESVKGMGVSASWFAVLGARPALGRFFAPDEDRAPGGATVAVLSHRFWQERLGADPRAVGRTIRLNGAPFTVVGVAPEGFHGTTVLAPELWVPITALSLLGMPESIFASRDAVWLSGVARLAPGVTIEAAQADLGAIAHALREAHPRENEGKGIRLAPAGLFPGEMRTMVQRFMGLLLAVAGLVLLVASTNVAGMLLARATTRRREVAVRLAVGASRGRLVRQLATESVLLFVIAGAAGLLVARWMTAALLTLLPRLPVPVAFDPSLDGRVLGFALGLALVAGLLAGLVPALQSTRPAVVPALKGEEGVAGSRRLRLRSGLVVAQLAFSLLLIVGAGLFLRALAEARSIDPGFEPRGVELASLDLGVANLAPDAGRQLGEELVRRAAALPGVTGAALAVDLPLDGGNFGLGPIAVEGREPPPAPDGRPGSWRADWNVVTPGYHALLRIPIVDGRDFTAADRAGAPEVAIINETLAAQLFPGERAVGRTIRNEEHTLTVVGVSRDAKYRSLGSAAHGFIYVPLAQRYMGRTTLLTRLADGAPSVAQPVRRLVAELNPALPVVDQQTLAEYTAMALLPQRVALWVAGSLGVVALLLAVIGIYGITAYSVAQRARELGIRVALGASRGGVLRLVLRDGTRLALVGAAVGLAGAAAVTRLLAGLLYGVPPIDPIAFGGAAALLVSAAVLASWVPARRASRVDPMIALRGD